jgi:hypothetical protein
MIRICISSTIINISPICDIVIPYVIKHCLLYYVIYRYMCDLTSWVHILLVLSIVFKTGCDIYHGGVADIASIGHIVSTQFCWRCC